MSLILNYLYFINHTHTKPFLRKFFILSFICFTNYGCFLTAQNVVAPESYTPKALECFQPNRKLPVFYFNKGENTKAVTDTFWIWNTTNNDIPVHLNPYYHKDWNMPELVKAKSKAPLVYYRTFDHFEGYYFLINTLAKIEYGNEKLLVTLYTQLINKNAIQRKTTDGGMEFLIPLDSVKHNYLLTFPNGMMKESGCKLNADSSKIGEITKTAKFGDGYDVEYHGKNFSFELMNADIKNCKVFYTHKHNGKSYPIYITNNKFNYTFPDNASEIKIVNDSSSITYPLKNGDNNRTIPLYVLRPNETYIIIKNVKFPVDYKHQQYVVFYNLLPSQDTNLSTNIHYENKYPGLKIYHIYQNSIFDLEQLNETERINILHTLQNDHSVNSIIKLIEKTNGKNMIRYFENHISCNSTLPVTKDSLIEKLTPYGFEYFSSKIHNEYTHHFKYQNKLWDEKSLQLFNALYQKYPYYEFKIQLCCIKAPPMVEK